MSCNKGETKKKSSLVPKPMPRPTSSSSINSSSRSTEIKLLEWAKTLGFMPPPAEDMKKLCRWETKPIWEHVIKCVRPKKEVAHIRRVLAERRRRKRVDGPARKSEPALRREALELELARRTTQLADGRALLKRLTSDCDSGVREYESLDHAVAQDELKINLLTMKTEALNREVSLMEDYAKMADFLVSGLKRDEAAARVKPRANPGVVAKLRECLAELARFHETAYGRYNVGDQVSWGHEDKAELQRFVLGRTADLTKEETWRALLFLQDELNERTRLMRDKTLNMEEDDARAEGQYGELLLHKLEAMYVCTSHRVTTAENGALSLRLDQMFQECCDLIVQKLDSASILNQTSTSNSALAEEWLEKRVMCVRLQVSVIELDRVLVELHAETERLLAENQTDELARLELVLRREELGRTDVRADYHLSLVGLVIKDVDTVFADIGCVLADPRLADSARVTSELLARRRGLTGQEIRLFCDFPLDSVDSVSLPTGEKNSTSALPINQATSIAVSNIDEVILDLHRKKTYARQLGWALEDRLTLETIPVYDLARTREAEHRVNADTWTLLNRLTFETDECEGQIDSLARSHASYLDHPIQRAVPGDMTAGGLTLAQWKRKYEQVYGRLDRP